MSIRARPAPAVYEFFAGGGLAGLGLHGFRTLFANDMDRAKAASWRANHAGDIHVGDVWTLDAGDLPGRADLAWASSPCQDVSLAGARGGLGARRSGAFWGFWRLIEALETEGRAPPVIVIENVAGLLTSGQGQDFGAICDVLAGAGYRVGALEMDASHWLPQSRPRLFIVAMRGLSGPVASGPVGPFHSARVVAARIRLSERAQAAWVWWSLPAPPRRNLDLAALLEPDTAVDWFTQAQTDVLMALTAPLHRDRLEAARASGERRVAAGFRRVRVERGQKVQRLELRFDGLAGCLRTPSGGSSRQYVIVCEAGVVRARRLTGREAARLMGLPDSYVLPRGEAAALKLMGDAVAVPVVRALSDGLLRPALEGRAVSPASAFPGPT
ncbi:Modification methylase HpaII [Brevundimonas subvibrioides]|uniref:DNA cytosine methyltransferase n=1 Tax=Brevundimonas subvibrioides TaxID=74313 RepID=UPI0032D56F36